MAGFAGRWMASGLPEFERNSDSVRSSARQFTSASQTQTHGGIATSFENFCRGLLFWRRDLDWTRRSDAISRLRAWGHAWRPTTGLAASPCGCPQAYISTTLGRSSALGSRGAGNGPFTAREFYTRWDPRMALGGPRFPRANEAPQPKPGRADLDRLFSSPNILAGWL